jgi:hypothetical protein
MKRSEEMKKWKEAMRLDVQVDETNMAKIAQ